MGNSLAYEFGQTSGSSTNSQQAQKLSASETSVMEGTGDHIRFGGPITPTANSQAMFDAMQQMASEPTGRAAISPFNTLAQAGGVTGTSSDDDGPIGAAITVIGGGLTPDSQGWVPHSQLPDGTWVYRSTDPEDPRLRINSVPDGAASPPVPGYKGTHSVSAGGSRDVYYEVGPTSSPDYGSYRPIGLTEGFFTFNGVGRTLKGGGQAIYGAVAAVPTIVRQTVLTVSDVGGYIASAAPWVRAHQPESALFQTLQRDGAAPIVRGVVQTAIAPVKQISDGLQFGRYESLGEGLLGVGALGATRAARVGNIALETEKIGTTLTVNRPRIFSDPTLTTTELTCLQRDFAIKQRAIERAAHRGELVWSPETGNMRISSLQEAYRNEVAARYSRRYGVDLNLSRLNADHPVDLIIGGSPSQRLKLLDESINKSVGASLLQAGRRASLQPGDPIRSVVFK